MSIRIGSRLIAVVRALRLLRRRGRSALPARRHAPRRAPVKDAEEHGSEAGCAPQLAHSSMRLVKQATAARQAEQWEEAAALFTKAVKLQAATTRRAIGIRGRPYYSLDKFAECKESFRRVTKLTPKNGAAFAFLGLCEFGLKEYDRALQHLMQSRYPRRRRQGARERGALQRSHPDDADRAVQQALQTLGEFATEGTDNPRIIEAMGIATLRMPMLADEVPARPARDGAHGRPRQLQMATRQHRRGGEGVRGAGRSISGDAERALRLGGVSAASNSRRQGDRRVQEGARTSARRSGVADADRLRVLEAERRAEALPWAQQAVDVAPSDYAEPSRRSGEALLETGDAAGAHHAPRTGGQARAR